MADPYEMDSENNPVAEADSVGEIDVEATEALRRQVAATLRSMTITTVIGVVIIAILAVVLADIRGLMILVGIVYLITSVVARLYLRRTFRARLARGIPVAQPDLPANSWSSSDDAPPSGS